MKLGDDFLSFGSDEPDTPECGEGCGRKAVVEVGGMVYCAPCLDRYQSLGRILTEATEQAEELKTT